MFNSVIIVDPLLSLQCAVYLFHDIRVHTVFQSALKLAGSDSGSAHYRDNVCDLRGPLETGT